MATTEPEPWKVENLDTGSDRVRMELIDADRNEELVRLVRDGRTVEIGVDDGVGEVLEEETPRWAVEVARCVGIPEVR